MAEDHPDTVDIELYESFSPTPSESPRLNEISTYPTSPGSLNSPARQPLLASPQRRKSKAYEDSPTHGVGTTSLNTLRRYSFGAADEVDSRSELEHDRTSRSAFAHLLPSAFNAPANSNDGRGIGFTSLSFDSELPIPIAASGLNVRRVALRWTLRQRAAEIVAFLKSPIFARACKCAVAYLLASLVVFNGHISSIFGVGDGKHLAATASVYFHAARTVGSMIEANIYAEVALFYSSCLAGFSMLVSRLFLGMDMINIGHSIVLIVFCAGGLGSIAYMKQRMNRPTFSTACSLASVSFSTILIREGSIQRGSFSLSRMVQVSAVVNGGIIIATCVCLLLFPVTAISELKYVSTSKLHKS